MFFTERAEPFKRPVDADEDELTTTKLREAAVTLPRGVAPNWCRFVTVSIDVQGNRFEILVMGWGEQGERVVIDRFPISQPPDHAPRAKNEDGRYRLIDPGRYAEDADVLLELADRAYQLEGESWALKTEALAELLAEQRTAKGYEKKQGVTRNETLDLAVQALATAEHKGLNRINPEAPPDWAVLGPGNAFAVAGAAAEPEHDEPEAAPAPAETPPPAPRRSIGWLKRR